jgi:ankyrin repeat protein
LTSLHIAAQKGEAAIARLLLRGGGAVDARTNMSHTPLHLAAEEAQLGAPEAA